jgi:hypothetical protein
LPEGDEDRPKGAALVAEDIVIATAGIVVGMSLEHTMLDQCLEPSRQDVAGDAETLVELLEPGHAEEGVANDQQSPPLPDDFERAGHGTGHVFKRRSAHASMLVARVA